MSKDNKPINLAGFAFGSCLTGSFIYILPKICNNPVHGFGVIASFAMLIAGLCSGLIGGITLGFLIWLLFRILKSGIYAIHYITVSLLGALIGFLFMGFLDKSGVFLR